MTGYRPFDEQLDAHASAVTWSTKTWRPTNFRSIREAAGLSERAAAAHMGWSRRRVRFADLFGIEAHVGRSIAERLGLL